jgi:hypothetical protein
MARRWSKLQKSIYNLIDEALPLQVHVTEMPDALETGSLNLLGIFWVTLEKEVIWHFPKDFVTYQTEWPDGSNHYSYSVADINRVIREYIDTPLNELLAKQFAHDYCAIADVLKVSDRRFAPHRLAHHFENTKSKAVRKILDHRLSSLKKHLLNTADG